MRTRALIATVVMSFALFGCAVFGLDATVKVESKKVPQADCKPSGRCEVQVWVDCSHLSCATRVDYEFIVAHKNSKPDIVWKITDSTATTNPTPANFEFAPDDKGVILIDQDDPEQFTGCKTISNSRKRQFTCKDNQRNSETVVYKYTINIVDASGTYFVTPLDPWVINN